MPKKLARKRSKGGIKQTGSIEPRLPELVEKLRNAFGQAAGSGAEKPIVSLIEASTITGYTREYLVEAIHAGTLKAEKVSGRWSLKREDLDRWVAENARTRL